MKLFKHKPRIVSIKRESLACPAAWEGRLSDGRILYIRFRHGSGTVRAAPSWDKMWTEAQEMLHTWSTENGDDGYMTDFRLRDELKRAGIKITDGLFPDFCDCDPDHLDLFGCEVCGNPASDIAIKESQERFKRMLRRLDKEGK